MTEPSMTAPPSGLAAPPAVFPRPTKVRRWRNPNTATGRFMSRPFILVALVALLVVVLAALMAPLVAPYGYDEQNPMNILQPPFWQESGSTSHILGTDTLGRDVLSRILYAGRVSLAMGAAGVVLGGTLGVVIGLLAGYMGGRVDAVVMRLADVQLAFPYLLLAIAVIAAFGTGIWTLIVVLGLRGWVVHARVVRGSTLSLKNEDFVLAARIVGATHMRRVFRHILPNAMSPLIVIATATLAQLIILEATLSFLGLGVPPPAPSWGGMLSSGRSVIATAWWLATFPGVAIMIVVFLVSVVGDGLRDALEPRMGR